MSTNKIIITLAITVFKILAINDIILIYTLKKWPVAIWQFNINDNFSQSDEFSVDVRIFTQTKQETVKRDL